MNELMEIDKELKFFLATDDVNEEKYIRELYKERIVVSQDKE